MKRAIFVTWVSALLGAVAAHGVVACASSEPSDSSPSADGGGNPSAVPDGAVVDDAAPAGDGSSGPACSPDGWCETAVPDDDLTFVSIWPLEGRAFATAQSPEVGFKVLEWSDADAKWVYIDDKSQNQAAPSFISNVWAPSENEVYYAIARGTIAHGTRPSPGAPWTWKYDALPNNVTMVGSDTTLDRLESLRDPLTSDGSLPTIGVWGTSAGDVYAWYTNTIFHRVSENGAAPTWVAEYTADDTSSFSYSGSTIPAYVLALGATGTGPDDLWFTYVRIAAANPGLASACPVIVRKTPAGYSRIADGVVSSPSYEPCTAAPGYLLVGPTTAGWLTNLQPMGNDQVAGVVGGRELVKVSSDGDGYSVTSTMIMSLGPLQNGHAAPTESSLINFVSAYATSSSRMWFAAQQHEWYQKPYVGNALAVRGDDVWAAGAATYRISSLSLSGAPLAGALPRIRGTSDTNLWLVSKNHALHKTQ